MPSDKQKHIEKVDFAIYLINFLLRDNAKTDYLAGFDPSMEINVDYK
jgi:hypothetical protein